MKYWCDAFITIQGDGYTIISEKKLIETVHIRQEGLMPVETELIAVHQTLKICTVNSKIFTDCLGVVIWLKNGIYRKVKREHMIHCLNLIGKCMDLMKEKNVEVWWESRSTNVAGIYNDKLKQKRKRREKGILKRKEKEKLHRSKFTYDPKEDDEDTPKPIVFQHQIKEVIKGSMEDFNQFYEELSTVR